MELRIPRALEVEEDGRVVRIAGAKQRTLLALLLLHANDPSRDRLIEELQVHVSQLRKALGRDLIVTAGARLPDFASPTASSTSNASSRRSYAPAPRPPGEAAALLREALACGAVCRSPR